MKSSLLLKSAALVALLGAAVSAHAVGITVNSGDLVLGFQDSSNSIIFDLGNQNSYLLAGDGLTHQLSYTTNINTALSYSGTGTTGYGSGWASNSGIIWTAYSVANQGTSNYFVGGAAQGPVVAGAHDAPLSNLGAGPAVVNSTHGTFGDTTTAQNSLATQFSTLATQPTSVQLKAGGSTILAAKYANSNGSSVYAVDKNTAAGAFGGTYLNSFNINSAVTNTAVGTAGLLAGKTYSAIDLFQFTGTGAGVSEKFLGTIALVNDGSVFFTAAIPEPSTYAAILGVATLGFAALRRRKQNQVVA